MNLAEMIEAVTDERERLTRLGLPDAEVEARMDAFVFGTGFTVDGKHVDPLKVRVYVNETHGRVRA